MKKVLFILLLIISLEIVYASEKSIVTLNKCVDGDTAWFNLNNEVIKTRFLAIDTPESTNEIEFFGKESSSYTCNLLMNAKKIEIEYDDNSDLKDKYDRHLVWVFVDDVLLQDLIIKNGYGEIKYLYGDYKYTDVLQNSEIIAKANKLGIWQNDNSDKYLILGIILIIIIVIVCIFNEKFRNKIFKKAKRKIKKEIKSYLK